MTWFDPKWSLQVEIEPLALLDGTHPRVASIRSLRLGDHGCWRVGWAPYWDWMGQEGDSHHHQLTVTVDRQVIHSMAKGAVKDGRLVRVERMDPDVFAVLVDRVK